MSDVNPEKSFSIVSFFLINILLDVCSINVVGISSSHFRLGKQWFSSPCFPFGLKKVAGYLLLVSPVDMIWIE